MGSAVDSGFAGEVLVGTTHDQLFARSAGLADREARIPHAPGEVWRWASVSKQVAALLTLQQVDAQRLSLTDTVGKLLPDWPGPGAAGITVRQLLQHTSGLPNPDDSDKVGGVPDFYLRQTSDAAALDTASLAFCGGRSKAAPGERFDYNNCDTLVLAAILARLEHEPYARIVQDRVAAPLGLKTLALNTAASPAAGSARAVAYDAAGQRLPQPRLATFGAAAALEGSAADLLQFDRALLSGRLLSQKATETMWTGDPRLGFAALGAWAFETALPGCKRPVKLVERRGDVGGIQVRNLIAPASGVIVIVFSNDADLDFGEIWQGRGLAHDLVAAAVCGQNPGTPR